MSPNEEARTLIEVIYSELKTSGTTSRIDDAARMLAEEIESPLKASLANILAHHYFHAGQFQQALVLCRTWHQHDPGNHVAGTSVLSALPRLRRWEEAIGFAQEQLAKTYDNYNLHSSLSNALGHAGRLSEARAHGTLALALKDASARAKPHDLSNIPVPAFNSAHPKRNVISFSLFGAHDRYSKGACLNARAAPFVYPEWTCRFYVDESVSESVLRTLIKEGAEVRRVSGLPKEKFGTFWRFLVADDSSVERFIFRDCDSLLNVRERVAVDEWIVSQRHFHLMRDSYSHSELVLGGLWGGVRGSLPPMAAAIRTYVEERFYSRTLDQQFLRDVLWPTIRQSVLSHDSQFAFGEQRNFPSVGTLARGKSVGDAHF